MGHLGVWEDMSSSPLGPSSESLSAINTQGGAAIVGK